MDRGFAMSGGRMENKIAEAKLMLDEARVLFEHHPTPVIERVVDDCERELNELLDTYRKDNAHG